jgi:hypothetical protein
LRRGGDPGRAAASPSYAQKRDTATIEAYFADVPAMFTPFYDMPDPDGFRRAIDELNGCAQALTSTQSAPDPAQGIVDVPNTAWAEVTTVGDNLASWSGAAAREFKANYLDVLPIQAAGQLNAIVMCRRLFEQEQAIWREARENVASLLNDAIDCLNDMPHQCSQSGWTTTLTVIAAVAALAALPLAEIEVGLAIVDGVASAGTAIPLLPDDPPRQLRFSASNAAGVIKEVGRGLRELITRIGEQEAKIAYLMNAAADVVGKHRPAFVPKRPMLSGATRANVAGQDYFGFSS